MKIKNDCKTEVLVPSETSFGWTINPYNGCTHGCLYCYAIKRRGSSYTDCIQAQPKKDLIPRLENDIKKLKKCDLLGTIRDVMLSSLTDAYQPLEIKYCYTRQVLEILRKNNLPFTILTKSDLVLRDIDLLKGYKWCRAGVTITSLDECFRKDLEPNAASYDKRINVLSSLKSNGISTYLCCEPIMPVPQSDPILIADKLKGYVDLFEFGKYSYKDYYDYTPTTYLKHFKDKDYYPKLFKRLISFCQNNNVTYCNSLHTYGFLHKNKLPFQRYPPIKPIMPKRQQCLIAYC